MCTGGSYACKYREREGAGGHRHVANAVVCLGSYAGNGVEANYLGVDWEEVSEDIASCQGGRAGCNTHVMGVELTTWNRGT